MKTSKRLILTFSVIFPLVSGCTITEAVEPPATKVYQTSKSYQAPAASFSQQHLDSLLAPVALYPDSLLSHILIASTYPIEVVEADRWARDNSRLTGEQAVNAVENKNWDPSVKALVAFPDVLKRMSEDLDWTRQLGDAFLEDEGRVMDSVQNLRQKAYTTGNLNDSEHVKVVREERVIYIEPAVERVVYVPVYDTRVVYGPWWWPDYPPVYWHHYASHVHYSGAFYWGPRVYIGPSFHFSSFHWTQRRVVVIDHHHHHDYYHHRHAYTGRHLAHYHGARHWSHNPVHRRGVAYYNEPVRARYNSNREPTRNAWDERQRSRDKAGVISLNPNRDDKSTRTIRRESGENRGGNHEPGRNSDRAEALKARMVERRQPNSDSATRIESRRDSTSGEARDIVRQNSRSDANTTRTPPKVEHRESSPRQIIRQNNQSTERVHRAPRVDRQITPRHSDGGSRRIIRD